MPKNRWCSRGARLLLFLVFLFFLSFLLLQPQMTARAVQTGLALCAARVLPALFPFTVAAAFAVNCGLFDRLGGFLCRLSGDPFRLGRFGTGAFLIGILSGFPLGSITVFRLYENGRLQKTEAERLAGICNNASPAFLISYVGYALFDDAAFGVQLVFCQLCAALLLLSHSTKRISPPLLANASPKKQYPATAKQISLPLPTVMSVRTIGKMLADAVKTGAYAMVTISGFVVFFSVLCAAMNAAAAAAGQEHMLFSAILGGLCEVTAGCALASGIHGGKFLCAFFCGFAGLCVHFQAISFAPPDISLRSYFKSKLCAGIYSAAYFSLFSMLSPPLLRRAGLTNGTEALPGMIVSCIGLLLLLFFLLLLRHRRLSK